MKVLVGFSDTYAGTLKYLIHTELGGGFYLAERFTLMQSFYGTPYLASGKVRKLSLIDIREEEI